MKQSKVFAHRGASQYAPENTLEAFRLAMEQGAEGIELDVHLSADGELVVIHDETLERTTNGTGLVKDHTLAQLQALRADNHMEGFEAARIPTLRQVLELVRPGDMQVNIELKTGILWYEGIEEKTLELVKELGERYPNLKSRVFGAMQRLPLPEWGPVEHRRMPPLEEDED